MKMVPNPEYERAKFAMGYTVSPHTPEWIKNIPEIRTNNPNYITDGCKESDIIPSHIPEVEK